MTPLLPQDVLAIWDAEGVRLPDPLRSQILAHGAPMRAGAVRLMIRWTDDGRWEDYLSQLGENDRYPKMDYALFTTLETVDRLPAGDQARRLASRILGGQRPENATPDAYYRDCLALRKLLVAWLSAVEPPHNFEEGFRNWLKVARIDDEDKDSRATTVLNLLNRVRIAGVPRSTRRVKYSPDHLSQIERPPPATIDQDPHQFQPPPKDKRLDQEKEDGSPLPSYRRESREGNKQAGPVGEEPSDPDSPVTYRRPRSDLRSPRDDRRNLAKLPWLEGLSGTPTEFDLHRLPLSQVVGAIGTLYRRDDMIEWAFAWLLATTGLPPNRLRQLKVTQSDDTPLTEKTHCRVDLSRETLEYRLLDGPSGPSGAAHRRVALTLPRQILHALGQIDHHHCSFDPEHPFTDAQSRANVTLRRHFLTAGGLTATCQRIRAAAEGMAIGLSRDITAGLTLTGSYGHSARGPAAYRVIDRDEIQALFVAVAWQLALHGRHASITPDEALPIPPRNHPAGLGSEMGSSKTLTTSAIAKVFETLAERLHGLCRCTREEQKQSGIRISTLIDLQNTSSLYTYLGLLLSTGIRPVGPRTVFHAFGSALWYVEDKDSVEFFERRLVPSLPSVKEQLDIHQSVTNDVRLAMTRRGIVIKDREPAASALPRFIEQRATGAIARRVLQKDFMPIAEAYAWDRRATRHTVATQLRPTLPASELDALLGHSGGGWQRSATMSMASQPFSRVTIDALERLIDDAGFSLLDPRGTYVI